MSKEHTRLVVRSLELLAEMDPRKAVELLQAWAEVMDMPSPCFPTEQTGEALALAVAREMTVEGGQTVDRFVERAAEMGYTVTIEELDAARTGVTTCGEPLRGEEWIHVWKGTSNGTPTEYARTGSARCGDKLVTRHQFDLECVIEKEKPAHSLVIFEYTG